MRIASVTLAGCNRPIIGEALASVAPWVDLCIVFDTAGDAATVRAAAEVAGEKLAVVTWPWCDDFAAARNATLQAATDARADWAVIVDTDERIQANGEDLRETLARSDRGALMMLADDLSYAKARAIRLPTGARFVGRTHEVFPAHEVGAGAFRAATFRELPKSPEQLAAKFARDVRLLQTSIEEDPGNPRWHFYLGDTLRNMGSHRDAIAAYDRCTALRGWPEESAWAAYHAAECCLALNQPADAIDHCATGLARHPGIAELAWLAGFASYQARRYSDAVHWSRLAVTHGLATGHGASVARVGFRHLPALYEGPFDVLRWALRALGDEAGAKEAESQHRTARAQRRHETGT